MEMTMRGGSRRVARLSMAPSVAGRACENTPAPVAERIDPLRGRHSPQDSRRRSRTDAFRAVPPPRYNASVRLCSVSVDLDEIACYAQIHGLRGDFAAHPVYDVALARIRDFASSLRLPLTLFVVGRDLERQANVTALRAMVEAGHEIGNHSFDHWYDLTRRSVSEQQHQIAATNARIEFALGVRPSGFRAPGYTVSDALLSAVRDCGMSYDSSVFPCPPYYGAKALLMLQKRLLGQRSAALLDRPRVLRAPIQPYRVGNRYWERGAGLVELPIQVAGMLRLPFIGTTLNLLGPVGARLLTRSLLGELFINLELHGLDFLDSNDVESTLVAAQPDLRVSTNRKLEALTASIDLLRGRGYTAVRLDEAAKRFS